MNQTDRVQQAADALAAVSGLSPVAAKRILGEYDTRDLIASAAAEGIGGGNGATGGTTLLGPFAITYQTAGLVDPGDNGALVGTVPAGSLVLAAWIQTTTPWVAATAIDEIDMVLDSTGGSLLSLQSGAGTDINADMYELHLGANPVRALWLAVEDQIAVAIYTTGGGLTAGAGNVYALVATV